MRQTLTTTSRKNYIDIEPIIKSYLGEYLEKNLVDIVSTTTSLANYIKELYVEHKKTFNPMYSKHFNPMKVHYITNIISVDAINNKDLTSEIYKRYLELQVEKLFIINIEDISFEILFITNNEYNMYDQVLNIFTTLCYFARDRIVELSKRVKIFKIYFVLYEVNRQTLKGKTNLEEYNGFFNCSSGYTSVYVDSKINKTEMLITRFPEHIGLFIHEMGHLLGFDFETIVDNNVFTLSGMLHEKKCSRKIISSLPIDNNIINGFEMPEAINNYNTTILRSIFNSIIICESFEDINFINIYNDFLRIEFIYCVYHSAKILSKYNFLSYDDFFSKETKVKLQQKALLFEYTVVRMLMFLNVDIYKFMKKSKVYRLAPNSNNICEYQKSIFSKDNIIRVKDLLNKVFKIVKYGDNLMNMEYFCIDFNNFAA